MGSLVFYREKLANQVLIVGVKKPEDPLFYKILGTSQLLSHHPFCLRHKLEKGRGRRTAAIHLNEDEYKVYWNDGRFCFRGTVLDTGEKC